MKPFINEKNLHYKHEDESTKDRNQIQRTNKQHMQSESNRDRCGMENNNLENNQEEQSQESALDSALKEDPIRLLQEVDLNHQPPVQKDVTRHEAD